MSAMEVMATMRAVSTTAAPVTMPALARLSSGTAKLVLWPETRDVPSCVVWVTRP